MSLGTQAMRGAFSGKATLVTVLFFNGCDNETTPLTFSQIESIRPSYNEICGDLVRRGNDILANPTLRNQPKKDAITALEAEIHGRFENENGDSVAFDLGREALSGVGSSLAGQAGRNSRPHYPLRPYAPAALVLSAVGAVLFRRRYPAGETIDNLGLFMGTLMVGSFGVSMLGDYSPDASQLRQADPVVSIAKCQEEFAASAAYYSVSHHKGYEGGM